MTEALVTMGNSGVTDISQVGERALWCKWVGDVTPPLTAALVQLDLLTPLGKGHKDAAMVSNILVFLEVLGLCVSA